MRLALALAVFLCSLSAQQPEMSTKEEAATFKARVNLVLVPVVVRDKAGRAVGTLEKPDFQLFDKGKPQVVTRFTVEKAGGKSTLSGGKPAAGSPGATTPSATMPERFVAYLFDDIH